jgi:hypothetical protein
MFPIYLESEFANLIEIIDDKFWQSKLIINQEEDTHRIFHISKTYVSWLVENMDSPKQRHIYNCLMSIKFSMLPQILVLKNRN